MNFEAVSNILQNEYMYDSAADFLPNLPEKRGDCLDLSVTHTNLLLENIDDVTNLYPVLVYNRDPLKLEHTLGVCLENTNIAWVVDVAGGLFIPLTYGQRGVENRRLVRSLDNFTVFFNGNYRWIVDKKNVLDSKEKITSNRRRYTTERKCCYLHPVSAMCGIYPFKVSVTDSSFSFFVRQTKKMSGCFRNGVDDIEFAHLTELFFDNLENYYGSNIPFSSEDEFLQEVQAFLDFREG